MAWDAADVYLLDFCAEELSLPGKRVLVADDSFGALCCAMSTQLVDAVHYSASAAASARHNLDRNGLPPVEHFDWRAPPAGRRYDVVLMRMPKALDLLADHCHRLRPHMKPGAVLICGVMDKHLSKGMLEVLSTHVGPTHTTLGRRKARLTVSEVDPALVTREPPVARYRAEPFAFTVCSAPGVFSGSRLDVGTRFFLEQFQQVPLASASRIADLACGNGVLGVAAALLSPAAAVAFYDDSSIAIHSAQLTVAENFPDRSRFAFHHCDGLSGADPDSLDLVLLNPPFHVGQQQDTGVAGRLFSQARRALRAGGELWVVGNRHLRYERRLRSRFGDVDVAASNPKFVVLRSRRQH